MREIQRAMFVLVVELVEEPQEALTDVPFVVRLQFLDPGDRRILHSGGNARDRISILVLGGEDWEGGVAVRGRLVRDDQLAGEMVEAGPDVVHAITEDRGQADRGRLGDDEKDIAEITLIAKVESAELAVQVGNTFFPKSVDVLLCPSELESGSVKRVGHAGDSLPSSLF